MQTELFYRKIIDQLPVGYSLCRIISDKSGSVCDLEFIEVNKIFEEITGLDSGNIIGKNVTTLFPDLKKEKFDWVKFFNDIVKNKTGNETEQYINFLKSWYKVKAFTVSDDQIVFYISESTDTIQQRHNEKIIEEQKRISKNLKDLSMKLASIPISQNIFRFICHSFKKYTKASSVSINIYHESTDELEYQYSTLKEDIDKTTLRGLNRIYKGIRFKLSSQLNDLIQKDLIIGKDSLSEITFDRTPASYDKIMEAIFGNGFISAVGLHFEGKLIGSIILSFDKKPGGPSNEELEALAGVCSNAMRRWMTETSLLEEEMHYRRLIASMQQGLALHEVMFDDVGNVIDCRILKINDAFEKITGLKAHDIIGKCVTDVMPSIGKEWIEKHAQVALTGDPINYEYYSEKLDKYYEVVSYRPGPNLFAVIFTDITERKRSEELREKVAVAQRSAEFKQKFLANMSHEIRTPLTGIMGMAEILAKTELTPQQLDYLNTIRFSTGNLSEIIEQILDYSKIEAGKTNIKPKVFNSSELLQNARKLFESICKKDIKLVINHSTEIPEYIEADNHLVFQIINNLLHNAVKFTNKGQITINASIDKWIDDENLMLKIEVIDTGVGIKPESKNLLFKPFSQIYTSDNRRFEGTGLGLSICKEIVSLLDGKIDFESKSGKGSNFWFTFKAKSAQKHPDEKKIDEKKIDEDGSELKVLHVEDKEVNQKVASLMLESLGCKVKVANNGKEALEMFPKEKFDIILMDIQMPVMDGITATKELKKKFSSLPPIVGLSANAFEGDKEKYMNMGLDDYMTKPFAEDDFIRILKKYKLK